MKSYSLIGIDPTLITHAGTINGQKPKIGAVFAEPAVKGGSAEFTALTAGGLFAFDKKAVVVESLIGTPTIVDPDGNAGRTLPAVPFKLLPNEWLKFTSGAKVGCVVRLDAQRIL